MIQISKSSADSGAIVELQSAIVESRPHLVASNRKSTMSPGGIRTQQKFVARPIARC